MENVPLSRDASKTVRAHFASNFSEDAVDDVVGSSSRSDASEIVSDCDVSEENADDDVVGSFLRPDPSETDRRNVNRSDGSASGQPQAQHEVAKLVVCGLFVLAALHMSGSTAELQAMVAALLALLAVVLGRRSH